MRAIDIHRRRLALNKVLMPLAHWRSWGGHNTVDGSDIITQLTDISGKGHHITDIQGSPELVTGGLNGKDKIEMAGTEWMHLPSLVRPDAEHIAVVCVFKVASATGSNNYNQMYVLGTDSTTSPGSSFYHLYNPYSTNNFINNAPVNTLDITITGTQLDAHYAINKKDDSTNYYSLDGSTYITKTGTQNVGNRVMIGGWRTSPDETGGDLDFYEMMIFDNYDNAFTDADKSRIEAQIVLDYDL